MLWIIITIICIIIGFIMVSRDDNFVLATGILLVTSSVSAAIILVIILACKPSDKRNFETSYALTEQLIQAQENNEHITADERQDVISSVICINRKIITSRKVIESPWIGIFRNDYSHLPLLEYNGVNYLIK